MSRVVSIFADDPLSSTFNGVPQALQHITLLSFSAEYLTTYQLIRASQVAQ